MSLKFALEALGYERCYHMIELATHLEHIPLWMAAADGEPDWDRLFEAYAATTDGPACLFWRELSDAYPDAKVILTIREAGDWWDSVHGTIGQELHQDELAKSAMGPFMARMADRSPVRKDRADAIAAFEAHNAAVMAAFGPERLLIFEARNGWQPLCDFLKIPVPEFGYPHINGRAQGAGLLNDDGSALSFEDIQGRARALMAGVGPLSSL